MRKMNKGLSLSEKNYKRLFPEYEDVQEGQSCSICDHPLGDMGVVSRYCLLTPTIFHHDCGIDWFKRNTVRSSSFSSSIFKAKIIDF